MAKKVFEFTRKIEVGKSRPTFEQKGPLHSAKGSGTQPPTVDFTPVVIAMAFLGVLVIIVAFASMK